MIHAVAPLMGFLLWRVQIQEPNNCELLNKLKKAETEIKELKTRRVEDATANEKVVGIFASHEQRWIMEKKKLTQQIHLLLKEKQVIYTKREESISELQSQLQDKDKLLEEEKKKRREQEETIKKFEAEMGRAVRQVEAEKQELDAVLEQKEQYVLMTQKLSMELIKTRKDLEQKDKILSEMDLDTCYFSHWNQNTCLWKKQEYI
ncbi:hypothetical protein QVD17_35614 [Tagetes erecta]|uniref:Uncharacterized protein n=1 Tax=Tagetes erecta TaxID=13708 RepID=A0AAD8JQV8_TARER|nr:hypothetical protein QVD17_35614 [Tagetes erecta]